MRQQLNSKKKYKNINESFTGQSFYKIKVSLKDASSIERKLFFRCRHCKINKTFFSSFPKKYASTNFYSKSFKPK